MKRYCVTRHGGLSETLADGGDLVYRVPDVDARIAELEKALREIAEECEYPACSMSYDQIARMARSVL